ncbi:hypothetical protein HRE53_29715 (plasmid) [Acaryochloris sp. 'Moss Beach']|uniref:hypothetical protein n=1 Tax=Acaryochloris sp. 'Moss Beach' TaxID=2740837 RepID=UPI001F256E62|nr:hypothetical protein [Acaryochloris sp. 'Moss Beach']UJB72789.1 hypothetical protein HRE53_29715 [Acaryochloris sp. 'Moss Beach']
MDMIKVHPAQESAQPTQRKIPWLFIGFATSYVFLFLAVLGIGANLASLREERSTLFVQTPNETIHAQRKDPLYRSEAQVKAYARQWFKTAYTWNSKDKEKKVGADSYPAKLWTASFAMDLGMREGWLQQVKTRYAQQLPLDGYLMGKQEAVIELTRDPTVQAVEEGLWRVTVVADRAHVKNDGTSQVEAMKVTLTVQAVPHSNSKENDILGLGTGSESLNALIHRWRKEGLKIVLVEAK